MKRCEPPKGMFQGVNFITPDVIGYFKLRNGYAELASGKGMDGQIIYGVTVRPGVGRGKLCQSLEEALIYIETMS